MSEKLTVAMICPTYNESTVAFSDHLVDGFDPDRFRAITIFLKQKNKRQKTFIMNGRKIYCLSGKKKLHALSLRILFRLVRIVKDEKVDIIHAHRHKPCFYGVLAGLIMKTRVILLHVHGLHRTKNLGRKMLNRFIFRQADKVIGCAESVRLDIIKSNPHIAASRVITLRNSVAFERFADIGMDQCEARRRALPHIPPDAFICGTVARFGPYKGHSYLIKAFAETRKVIRRAHLILAGSGDMEDVIRNQVEEENLSDCVHFLGHRRDVPELMRAMNLFVLPSIGSEGMPLVLLEAMACGTPCVATRLSGIPEVINSDDVGRLVPIKDEAALAAAIMDFSQMSASEVARITRNAKERIRKHFNHSVVVNELQAIYDDAYDRSRKKYRFPR